VQIYGAFKKLLAVHPEPETLRLMHEYCTAGGAPLHLPTLATNSLDVFKKCIDAVRHYWNDGGKGVYGLHLEGPWIHPEKRGAHALQFIHAPTMEEVTELLAFGNGVIKMITLHRNMQRISDQINPKARNHYIGRAQQRHIRPGDASV
jgi:N-acetylglucosamine-6-phosphate deacetylase